jgi:DNA-binding winged helix-turn-helix (wHTH) protein
VTSIALQRLPQSRTAAAVVESIGSVAAATVVVAGLEKVLPVAGLGSLYLLCVLVLAIRRGELAALATALLSVLALNFFFIAPRHQLTIANPDNVVALAVFLVVAVVVGRLAATAQQQTAEAEQLRALLGEAENGHQRPVSIGELIIDPGAGLVTLAGAEVHLTPIEFKLLSALARDQGKLVTHRRLLKEVWGPEYTNETQYLRVHVAHIRSKIEADPSRPRYLVTKPGVGYRLCDPADATPKAA